MFTIDNMSRKPVYEQIIAQTEKFLLTGILKPGDAMPSVRSLSISLSVNPNTIQKAYSQLDDRKIIHSVPGKGSFVCDDALDYLAKSKKGMIPELKNTINEMKLAGIPRIEIDTVLDEIYKGEDK